MRCKQTVNSMIIILSGILLFGCVSTVPQHRPYSETPITPTFQKTVKVAANGEWQDSTVELQHGDKIFLDAKGRWSGGLGWESGPSGAIGLDIGRIYPAEQAATALIGRIGTGSPFTVGDQYVGKISNQGNLYMRMNDPTIFDNSGELTVDIYVQRSSAAEKQKENNERLATLPQSVALQENSPGRFQGNAGQVWAVIIGISAYKDTHIPSLRYASSDAQSFYDWAVSSNGGKYAPSRVKLLLNHEATGREIKDALFSWLKQALEEDVVIIYFAGHGSPDSPDSSNNLYLLPYDTDYQNIASTGFPMWDIETALKRFIKAKKVVVIADACHSGGVGESFDMARRATRGVNVNPISSGLQNLSQIGNGVCVISASDDKQFSQESKQWGGGHGVFTYYLLEGLKGNADYNKDAKVSLGELIPYLSEQVRRATKNAQSPTVAGKFDPALNIGR